MENRNNPTELCFDTKQRQRRMPANANNNIEDESAREMLLYTLMAKQPQFEMLLPAIRPILINTLH